jgi:hypothetical protein
MFSKTIIDSDAFIDMPATARLLYFDLSMRSDDEGFCGSPQKIIRMTGASKEDLQTLIDSRFIIPFDSGVVVIRHWRIHNYIQSDRFHSTLFVEERKHIKQTANKSYELTDTECIQDVSDADTQVRLGKASIGKDRVGEARETETPPPTLEAVKARYRELCKEHHVTPIQGVAERFITYPHTHWESELKQWVSDDVAKGKYREANKAISKAGRGYVDYANNNPETYSEELVVKVQAADEQQQELSFE